MANSAKSGHPPHSITSSAPARPSMAPRVSGSAMGPCRSADHGLSLRHYRPSGQPRRGRNVRREFEAPRVRVTSASILCNNIAHCRRGALAWRRTGSIPMRSKPSGAGSRSNE